MIISSKPIGKRGGSEIPSTVKKPQRTQRVAPAPRNRPVPKNRNPVQPIPKSKSKPLKELSVKEIALKLLEVKEDNKSGCLTGKAIILFNHYKKEFPVYNSVVKWADVDEEYAFSFVYKGNYRREMYHCGERVGDNLVINKPPDNEVEETPLFLRRDIEGHYFIDVVPNSIYKLYIEEDPLEGIGAEGLRIREGPLKAADMSNTAKSNEDDVRSGNKAVQDITQQLLQMDTKDLHGEEARRLREARDVEDVLFS